ncbi:MAG: hypothetical protein MJ016_05345, partial [Victivallaceae bacterium]|nr:hypothetical protein [Victivallaceae bacterium]
LGKESWRFLFSLSFYRMALSSFVFPFILFSASSGKLPTYILPCLPGFAILLAGCVMTYLRSSLDSRFFHGTVRFWTFFLWTSAILAAVVAIGATDARLALLSDADLRNALAALRPALATGAVVNLLFGTALFVVRRKARTVILMTFFAGLAVLSCAINPMIPARIDNGKLPGESIDLVARTSGVDLKNADLIAIPSLGYAVAWTLGRSDVMLTPSPGELRYGVEEAKRHGEPHPFLTTDETLTRIRASKRPVLFFTRPDKEQIPKIKPKRRIIDQNIQLDVF